MNEEDAKKEVEKRMAEELKKLHVNKQIDLIDTAVNNLYGQTNIDSYTLERVLIIIQKFKL